MYLESMLSEVGCCVYGYFRIVTMFVYKGGALIDYRLKMELIINLTHKTTGRSILL